MQLARAGDHVLRVVDTHVAGGARRQRRHCSSGADAHVEHVTPGATNPTTRARSASVKSVVGREMVDDLGALVDGTARVVDDGVSFRSPVSVGPRRTRRRAW